MTTLVEAPRNGANGACPAPQLAFDALNPAQLRALDALVQGAKQVEAARVAGVSERTLHTWMREPAFKQALEEERKLLWLQLSGAMLAAMQRALDRLTFHAEKNPDARIQIRACDLILKWCFRLREMEVRDERAGLAREIERLRREVETLAGPDPLDPIEDHAGSEPAASEPEEREIIAACAVPSNGRRPAPARPPKPRRRRS